MDNESRLINNLDNIMSNIDLDDDKDEISTDDDSLHELTKSVESLESELNKASERKISEINSILGNKDPKLAKLLIDRVIREGPQSVDEDYLETLTTRVKEDTKRHTNEIEQKKSQSQPPKKEDTKTEKSTGNKASQKDTTQNTKDSKNNTTEKTNQTDAEEDINLEDEMLSLSAELDDGKQRKIKKIKELFANTSPKAGEKLIAKIEALGADAISDEYIEEQASRFAGVETPKKASDEVKKDNLLSKTGENINKEVETTRHTDKQQVTEKSKQTQNVREKTLPQETEDISDEDLEAQSAKLQEEIEGAKNNKKKRIDEAIGEFDQVLAKQLKDRIDKGGANAVDDELIQKESSRLREEAETKAKIEAEESRKKEEAKKRAGAARGETIISDDKMSAYITIYPPKDGGESCSKETIEKALAKNKIVFGIKEEVFDTIIKDMEGRQGPLEDILIAEGTLPEESKSGGLEELADFKPNEEISKYEEDKIPDSENYKATLVASGAKLLRMYEPILGTPGKNVLGEEVAAKEPPKLIFTHKQNVTLNEVKEHIFDFVSTQPGKAMWFERHIEVRPYNDGIFELNISKDLMEVTITINPPVGDGAFVEEEAILTMLAEKGVRFGINREKINVLLLQHKNYQQVENIWIAKGEAPSHGEDASLEIKAKAKAKHDLMFAKKIKHKDLISKLVTVDKDQLLAVKYPAGPPKNDGTNILGESIKAEWGRELEIKIEKNIVANEVGGSGEIEYYSELAGQFFYEEENKTLNVSPVYVVEKDVDMRVGNIYFKGDITIGGNILDDFIIEAEGSITVGGNIGNSKVVAKKDILVGNGIISRSGFVKTDGNITARFIENSTVEAGGNISVERAIMNSNIDSRGKVLAEGEKGSIIGGRVRATAGIKAKEIGSKAGTKTEVSVGMDFVLHNRAQEIGKERRKYSRYLLELETLAKRIMKQYGSIEKIPPKVKVVYANALKKLKQIKSFVHEKKMEEADLMVQMDREIKAVIMAHDVMHTDVRISIGRHQMDVLHQKESVTFFYNEETGKIDYRLDTTSEEKKIEEKGKDK